MASLLPSLAGAIADPSASALTVQALVRESLQESWREAHSGDDVLEALAALTLAHIAALPAPGEGAQVDAPSAHEAASAACLKLARNLCVGRPRVQHHWWDRGLVQALVGRVRADAVLSDERGALWCEVVPGFFANVIAGNGALRQEAFRTWFPKDVALIVALCWRRPELAFIVLQGVLTVDKEPNDDKDAGDLTVAPGPVRQLVETEDGHCLLFVVSSLLFRGGLGMEGSTATREPVGDKAWEWASIFFKTIWIFGGFEPAYRGVQRTTVSSLHSFWCAAVGVQRGSAEAPPGVLELLVSRLCHHSEVLGLFWHTIHALDSKPLMRCLLRSEAFADLVAEEICGTSECLAVAWYVSWEPLAEVPNDACEVLGVNASVLRLGELAALARLATSRESAKAVEIEIEVSSALAGFDRDKFRQLRSPDFFGELCEAVLALSALPKSNAYDGFPPRLLGVCLLSSIALLKGLHRLRFGAAIATADVGAKDESSSNVSAGSDATRPKREPTKEAIGASQACLLVEQVRICANLLFGCRPAQDFLRLTGGIPVLLSHCYSDADMPLLREAGVFAVRNASHENLANQEIMRALLAERRQNAAAAGGDVSALGGSLATSGRGAGQVLLSESELDLDSAKKSA